MVLSSEVHSNACIKDKEMYCIIEFSVSLVLFFGSVLDANIHVVSVAQGEKEHNVIPHRPTLSGLGIPKALHFYVYHLKLRRFS